MVLMFAIEIFDAGGYAMELRNLITFIHIAELRCFPSAIQHLDSKHQNHLFDEF